MKRMFNLAFVLIFLWASLAFPQQQQLIHKGDQSEASVAPATEKDDRADTLPKFSDDNARYGIQQFKARGGDTVDWGLALSGGGIRSAGFSIGVMKVLYDEGYLDNIDVISSVSGGSYASYWLFTKNDSSNKRFGKSIFEDNKFIQSVCDLQTMNKSNFVTNTVLLQYLPILIPGFFKIPIPGLGGKIFNLYKDRIHNSFGNGTPSDTKLCFQNASIENGNIPYFILNTTLTIGDKDKKKNKDLKRQSSKVFEITPHFRGNPVVGFREWANCDNDPLTFNESAAASGLPNFIGKHKINNYEPRHVSGDKLSLHDGGQSENLAALALIRRGVENIIIIDSEHDPHYKFKGYRDLIKTLDEIGIKFSIKEIDEFRKKHPQICPTVKPNNGKGKKVFSCSAIAKGEATSEGKIPKGGDRPVKSTIYYLKMSNPNKISFKRFLDDKNFENAHKALEYARRQGDIITGRRSEQLKKAKNDCAQLDFDVEKEKTLYADLYTHRVFTYEEFLNNNLTLWPPQTWINVNLMNALGKLWTDAVYKYPHTTTYDQSFYADQVEAFVGLGYLQAEELVKVLPKLKTGGVETN